eukprot:TRINITY_DN66518_c0_g1_i1.p1 TRINITY_DN66518_c0_g1~~TRINITY_DN66518_c0_g1_i1.p1  ORF type:complete len:307 (+),score=-10.05 TRINITY_DN66518_c0_g1_i1:21-941(+)
MSKATFCLADLQAVSPDNDVTFAVTANISMTAELLQAAKAGVRNLNVSFDPDVPNARTAYDTRHDLSIMDNSQLWLFELHNLVSFSFYGYPFANLPESIGQLTNLKHLHFCGSALVRFPRSVGRLKKLKELDGYMSYGLQYLPYEVVHCTALDDSCFSTRALYNSRTNRDPLPVLPRTPPEAPTAATGKPRALNMLAILVGFPFDVAGEILSYLAWNWCSVCGRQYAHDMGRFVWSHQWIGTDPQTLLAFCCREKCAQKIPKQMRFDSTENRNVLVNPEEDCDESDKERVCGCAWNRANQRRRGAF